MEARADKKQQFQKENFPFGLKQNQMFSVLGFSTTQLPSSFFHLFLFIFSPSPPPSLRCCPLAQSPDDVAVRGNSFLLLPFSSRG